MAVIRPPGGDLKKGEVMAFPVLLFVLLFPLVHGFTPRITAVVTGGNRGLGLAISDLLAEVGYHVILTARNAEEGQARVADIQRRHGQNRCEFMALDVSEPKSIKAFVDQMKRNEEMRGGVPHVLINNAGICVRDEDAAAAVEGSGGREGVYRSVFDINTWAPVALMEACLPGMCKHGFGCIVNISSGDGELAYLHSEVAKRLKRVRSLAELKQFSDWVAQMQQEGPWPRGEGLAPVSWPAYSFSKAVLNAATRLLQSRVDALVSKDMKVRAHQPRIVAICPGDVNTAMCDEHAAHDALSPEQAALDVVWAVLHSKECHGGYFYRARRAIPW